MIKIYEDGIKKNMFVCEILLIHIGKNNKKIVQPCIYMYIIHVFNNSFIW